MGEFADEAIERLLSDTDYWEDGPRNITCKRCGADELYWEEARGERNEKRWVLMEHNGEIHVCPDAPSAASADEFDTVEPHEPIPQNSAVRARAETHHEQTRNIRAKRIRPVDTVPRKYGVPRKPRRR
jgi:hypothetical protein